MTSRFAAARPKRAAEKFARAHHGEDEDGSTTNKKVRFDLRNPSKLAPTVKDDHGEDDVLAADVIGGAGRNTKRGAVNIDGYDSDSENDAFEVRAEARAKKGRVVEDVDLTEVLDNYDARKKPADDDEDDEDDEVDMFGGEDEDGDEKAVGKGRAGKKGKDVRLLADKEIEGQDKTSKSGGTVRLDDVEESSDEEDIGARIVEEDIDEEVGLGGLKKHAPRIDAFNMRQEQEEGAFDESGNFIRKAVDAEAVHDRWLDGLSKKDIKKAAAAHEKREEEERQRQRDSDSLTTSDLLKDLILRLDMGENALEALARLGKNVRKPKKVPKWKLKKQREADGMDVDTEKEDHDPKQVKLKKDIDILTDAADKLLKRDYPEIYETERERLVREYCKESGEPWLEPLKQEEEPRAESEDAQPRMWEFRWTDGRDDGLKQGPFDGPTMKAWQTAGYFSEGVEFRLVDRGEWSRIGNFA